MALFTGKGDDGTTQVFTSKSKNRQAKTFGAENRISKSSKIAEVLGSLDEVNSFLGICKMKSKALELKSDFDIEQILHQVQKDLFIVQAELAGAPKSIERKKVTELEDVINSIEKVMPSINSFFVSGGTELASFLDFSRTLARRAERRVIAVIENDNIKISDDTKAFLNRLSSLLYALVRLVNYSAEVVEEAPTYE